MKLHLPKSLLAAVVVISNVAMVQAIDVVYDVGLVDTTKNKASHSTKTLTGTVNEKGEKVVTVGQGQAIGAFTTEKQLITSFGSYEYANYLVTGDITSGEGATVTNNLKVDDTLEINGNGQVVLGGQIKITSVGKRDSYSGLIAGNVVVNGDGKTVNLQVESATIGTLTLNSGIAKIHTTGSSGGNSVGTSAPTVGTDCKIASFSEAINVNGGKLQMGYVSRAQSGNSHYMTFLGKNVAVNQTNGTIEIAGQARLSDGVKISQSGGTFDTPITVSGQLAFELGSGNFGVEQINPVEVEEGVKQTTPSLTIRRLASTSGTKTFDITQTSDAGVINITTGNNVAGSKFKLSGISTLKQDTKTGVINLSGDFSDAKYNIEQSGTGSININSDNVFNANNVSVGNGATLTVKDDLNIAGTGKVSGVVVADSVSQIGGELTIEKEGVLSTGTIELKDNATLVNHGTISQASSSSLATLAEDDAIAAIADDNENLIIIASGKVVNYGVIEKSILVQDGGTLTLGVVDGVATQTVVGAVTLESGANMVVAADATTGALTLNGGTITFEMGASLTSSGLTGLDKVEITVRLSDAVLADINDGGSFEYELFTNSTDADMDGITVNFVSTSGETGRGTVTQGDDGKVIISQQVPEPATATLSLLALAALAARRRRK